MHDLLEIGKARILGSDRPDQGLAVLGGRVGLC
jgi:hypothetical protein